jgi:hypothetical protein
MPTLQEHYEESMKRTGRTFKELHEWIDDVNEEYLLNHTLKKHIYSEELRLEVHKNFGGDGAVKEWIFHIFLDNLNAFIPNGLNINGNNINSLNER